MESFYKFYEHVLSSKSIANAVKNQKNNTPNTWVEVYIVFDISKNSIKIYKAYADINLALSAKNTLPNGKIVSSFLVNHGRVFYKDLVTMPNIQKVYVIMYVGFTGSVSFDNVYLDGSAAESHYFSTLKRPWISKREFHEIELITTLSMPPSTPKSPSSPYANLKYPLVGELTHYLSTANLNQEIYQAMRDKSQKSINLINQLRTMINRIELV